MPLNVCWFRTDLRVEDNPALMAAMQDGPTVGLFMVSPAQWKAHDDAPIKLDFWRRALASLEQELAGLNVPLVGLEVPSWADAPATLAHWCQEHDVKSVHCNKEQGINERRRDRAVYKTLTGMGVAMQGHDGADLLPPGSVLTGAGAAYRVFTPFARACRERLRTAPALPQPAPMPQTRLDLTGLPSPLALPGWPDPGSLPSGAADLWPADAQAAQTQLQHFVAQALHEYADTRDFPARPGTSRISPYLAAGILSPRQCLHAALAANQGELDSGGKGPRSWINELLWREFYRHLMHAWPQLSMHKPMQPETDGVSWRHDPQGFESWCQGKTGLPIVDAAMRQMLSTGWMHNRLRMICAMFLTKNLLIDWRLGESWFMRHLVDGDLASNNGGWQWSASTGADAAPYFRIFNPVTQSQKFDSEGHFIRRWVPELADVAADEIHDPLPRTRQVAGYPELMVDLKGSRERAIAAFAAIKKAE